MLTRVGPDVPSPRLGPAILAAIRTPIRQASDVLDFAIDPDGGYCVGTVCAG